MRPNLLLATLLLAMLVLASCHQPEQPPMPPLPRPNDPTLAEEVIDSSIVSEAGPVLDATAMPLLDGGLSNTRR